MIESCDPRWGQRTLQIYIYRLHLTISYSSLESEYVPGTDLYGGCDGGGGGGHGGHGGGLAGRHHSGQGRGHGARHQHLARGGGDLVTETRGTAAAHSAAACCHWVITVGV